MRCLACDVALTDMEATKRDSDGEFIDLCSLCLASAKQPVFTYNHDQDEPEIEWGFVIDPLTDSGDSL